MLKYFGFFLLLLTFACGEPQTAKEEPIAAAPVEPHRFESEIQAFEHADSMQAPPEDFVLFVGSSSVRMWQTLEEDLAPMPVLNRGFGGSTFEDLLYFADRIVFAYRPTAVVVYEGDNDIVNDTLKPKHVIARLQSFQEQMRQKLPGVKTYMLAIKPSVARRHLFEKAQFTNLLIQRMAEQDSMLEYIDIVTPMLKADGTVRSDIFIQDSLHMNATGYALWREVVRGVLLDE